MSRLMFQPLTIQQQHVQPIPFAHYYTYNLTANNIETYILQANSDKCHPCFVQRNVVPRGICQ